MTIMKRLEYPLIALTLTEKECDHIMALILDGALPRAVICGNIPRAMLHGDPKYQGLGVHNLYTTMGIYQLQAILENIWKDTITDRLMRVPIE